LKTTKTISKTNIIKSEELNKKHQIENIMLSIEEELGNVGVTEYNSESATMMIENESVVISLKDTEEKCLSEATNYLEGICEPYLHLIENSKYIRNKIEEDINLLSELKFQGKIAKFASQKLVENVQADQTYIRSYEGLNATQNSILEIIRHIVQIQNLMEDFYHHYFKTIAKLNLQIEEPEIQEEKPKHRLIMSPSELCEMSETRISNDQ